MKFMLLFYNDGRMRIVISSANLMAHDWDIIENGVWVQDFRPLPTAPVKTDFGDQWEMILDSLGVGKTFKLVNPVHTNLPFTRSADIHKWDFSRVTVRLIASIGGSGKDGWSAMETVGQCRLGKVLRDEGWVAGQGRALKSLEAQVSPGIRIWLHVCSLSSRMVCLAMQGSSLGNYSPKWTSEFFKSARGLDPRNWLGTRAGTEHAPIKIIYRKSKTFHASDTYYKQSWGLSTDALSSWLCQPLSRRSTPPGTVATVEARSSATKRSGPRRRVICSTMLPRSEDRCSCTSRSATKESDGNSPTVSKADLLLSTSLCSIDL